MSPYHHALHLLDTLLRAAVEAERRPDTPLEAWVDAQGRLAAAVEVVTRRGWMPGPAARAYLAAADRGQAEVAHPIPNPALEALLDWRLVADELEGADQLDLSAEERAAWVRSLRTADLQETIALMEEEVARREAVVIHVATARAAAERTRAAPPR